MMTNSQEIKKIKKEEKEGAGHQSDGEKSDQDLVVDDACSEDINPMSPMLPNQRPHHLNGGTNSNSPPRENGMLGVKKMEHINNDRNIVTPNSPRSSSSDRGSSSNGSTTPSNSKVKLEDKPSTPGLNGSASSGIPKSVVAKPPAGYPPGYLGPLNGNPHDMQAAYAGVLPPGHPAGSLNFLCFKITLIFKLIFLFLGYRGVPALPMGFEPHLQMRAPPTGSLSAMSGGKP